MWRRVEHAQRALGGALQLQVTAAASPTSLQLALENDAVRKAAAEYTMALLPAVLARDDAVGLAVAVNGKLLTADTYATHALFRKQAGRILDAAAVEAAAKREAGRQVPSPEVAAVRAWLERAAGGQPRAKKVTDEVTVVTRESGDVVSFETRDRLSGAEWLHRSYLAK